MSGRVTSEAVEAAALGIWQHYERHAASNSTETSDEDRAVARAALEAAAPYIASASLAEAADMARDKDHRLDLQAHDKHAAGWAQALDEVEHQLRRRSLAMAAEDAN